MDFGIDTFEGHPDADLADLDAFRLWNGGTPGAGKVVGGDPAFAGRNFLGGSNLWGHGEGTNALSHPSPKDFSKLEILLPRIAPVQAPMPDRQKVADALGLLYGKIDANALCTRIFGSLRAGEFKLPSRGFITVWLAVDADAYLSRSYWAGWADMVNKFSAKNLDTPGNTDAGFTALSAPLQAGILCKYKKDGGTGKFKRDPHVTSVLQQLQSPPNYGAEATCYALWADAADPDPEGIPPGPTIDWDVFDTSETPAPILWRISNSFRDANKQPADVLFSIDAVRPADPLSAIGDATDNMLITQQWQPSGDHVNEGFIKNLQFNRTQCDCINNNKLPMINDNAGGVAGGGYRIAGGQVSAIGRYIKLRHTNVTINRAEVELFAQKNLPIFTIWEENNTLVHGDSSWPITWPHLDPQNLHKKGADYFDPHFHAGTEDGKQAFEYAGNTLKQPPHTPIFFTIDGDALWDATPPRHHNPLGPNEKIGDWIVNYFKLIRAERDTWVKNHPDRPYLIGVYAGGRVLRELYTLGLADMYWQAGSPGWDGSSPKQHLWPWPHANRWQYRTILNYCVISNISNVDLDADWYDGGNWIVTNPLAQQLEIFEENVQTIQHLYENFGNLLDLVGVVGVGEVL